MPISEKRSNINYYAFLWHGLFLALASSFMDVDTIIPSMLIKAGGSSIHLGILTAIMLGGSSFFQLVFAGYLSGKSFKKEFLLLGINLRVASLIFLSVLFVIADSIPGQLVILMIFLLISIFSFSGSFANISYIDILGKSVHPGKRKKFFSTKQIINSFGFLVSALLVRELLKYYDYPINYAVLFIGAAILLFIASFGFWQIREVRSVTQPKKKLIQFFRLIPAEIRNNRNLKYYLFIINGMGLGLSLLPFIILYANDNFGLSYAMIGNFLLFRTVGMLAAGIFLFKYSQKFIYRNLLKFSLILGSLIPLLSLVLNENQLLFQMIFIFSGIFVATYKTSINGILLEISTDENRAIYTGISGAGNILTMVFPLFAGFLILQFGYTVVFVTVSIMVILSYIFVEKIDCKKPQRS